MLRSIVANIALASVTQQPLHLVNSAKLIAGRGIEGDRYGEGKGSYQQDGLGKRQLTLIDRRHLLASGYSLEESRRNIEVIGDVDLMRLFTSSGGVEFKLGDATCRGVKYCDPCNIPSNLAGKNSFRDTLWGCGGLIAEVIESGSVWCGCYLVAELKVYD